MEERLVAIGCTNIVQGASTVGPSTTKDETSGRRTKVANERRRTLFHGGVGVRYR